MDLTKVPLQVVVMASIEALKVVMAQTVAQMTAPDVLTAKRVAQALAEEVDKVRDALIEGMGVVEGEIE